MLGWTVLRKDELDRHMAAEQQEVEEAAARLRKMQARLREEDAAILRNGRWGGGGLPQAVPPHNALARRGARPQPRTTACG